MRSLLCVSAMVCLLSNAAHAADDSLRQRAAEGLRKACDFFQNEVSCEGGYLWRYSEDLQRREGEARAAASVVWVQPPGTPSVGMAFLKAYEATGDRYYLDAARRTGECLIRGQLRSGGWDYHIDFDPNQRARSAYRVEPLQEGKSPRNVSTLDDNNTQMALRFLMRLDQALELNDEKVHGATLYGLDHLVQVQYPNGAWPQRFQGPPDPEKFPVKPASYPDEWSRKYQGISYTDYYTFNDGTISDVIDVMLLAWRVYGDERFRAAAERGGQFILLAQMPDPQPAWAQQYDADMHPAWARKFEPPAITGGESQDAMRTLLQLARETGDKRYLEPIPRALAYLHSSELPGGKLARFYELRTNRPLYFTKRYELTYDDSDMPTHYSFQGPHDLDSIEREYERLAKLERSSLGQEKPKRPAKASPELKASVEKVLAALDERGRWISDGRLHYQGDDDPTRRIISCDTFIANAAILSRYLSTQAE
jgi:PelA/Pel-15E family pectate lyase